MNKRECGVCDLVQTCKDIVDEYGNPKGRLSFDIHTGLVRQYPIPIEECCIFKVDKFRKVEGTLGERKT